MDLRFDNFTRNAYRLRKFIENKCTASNGVTIDTNDSADKHPCLDDISITLSSTNGEILSIDSYCDRTVGKNQFNPFGYNEEMVDLDTDVMTSVVVITEDVDLSMIIDPTTNIIRHGNGTRVIYEIELHDEYLIVYDLERVKGNHFKGPVTKKRLVGYERVTWENNVMKITQLNLDEDPGDDVSIIRIFKENEVEDEELEKEHHVFNFDGNIINCSVFKDNTIKINGRASSDQIKRALELILT